MLLLNQNIEKEDYEKLLDYVSTNCNVFSFIQSRALMADETIAMSFLFETINDIQDSLFEMKEQAEWETNKLGDSTAYVFYYQVNESTINFLKEKSTSLFDWISPYLPEDLAFYKGEKVWLAANSHEGYFFCNEGLTTYGELMQYIEVDKV